MKFLIQKKFIKTNEKNVLFISTQKNTFDQISRNISHFFYEKHFINTSTDSVAKQVKYILRAKYIFVDDIYLPLGFINPTGKVIVNVGNENYSMNDDILAIIINNLLY